MLRLNTLALLVLALPAVAVAETRVVKGPYLMDPTPTSIAVLFELEEAAPADVVVHDAAGTEVARVRSAASDFHESVIPNLTPATRYTYEVFVGDVAAGGEGSFVTAPEPGVGPIQFIVVGDHRTDVAAHAVLVRAMSGEHAQFIVNTGDLVARGDDPEEWQSFFDVERSLLVHTPLFPTLGNHELHRAPGGYRAYRHYVRVPREGPSGESYYSFTYGPLRGLVLDSNDDWSRASAQRDWLEAELARAQSDAHVEHMFVIMHHGPFSSGPHGGNEDIAALAGMLRDGGVTLVLSGHDHMYERGESEGLKYVVTGGGGAPLYFENSHQPYQQHFEAAHHYLTFEIDGPKVSMNAMRSDGSTIERCQFEDRSAWRCVAADRPRVQPSERMRMSPLGYGIAIGAVVLVVIALVFWRMRRGR